MTTRAFVSSFDVDGVRTIATFATFAEARHDLKVKVDAWEASLTGPLKATPCACAPRARSPDEPAQPAAQAGKGGWGPIQLAANFTCSCGDVDGEIYGDDESSYEANCTVQQNVNGRIELIRGFFNVEAVDVPEGESADDVAAAMPPSGIVFPLPDGLFAKLFPQTVKPASGGGAGHTT